MMAGVNMTHVPYRGSAPALTDLLGGQVQIVFDTTLASIEYIRACRLRPLAATTATRLEALPEIPTVNDFLPGYEHADRDYRQACRSNVCSRLRLFQSSSRLAHEVTPSAPGRLETKPPRTGQQSIALVRIIHRRFRLGNSWGVGAILARPRYCER
jgi:hypothetical protein